MTSPVAAPALKARQNIATSTDALRGQHHGIMTVPTTQSTSYGSDYGSDIDEDTFLADALDTINEARPAEKSAALPSIEFEEGEREDEEQDVDGFVHVHRPALLRVAKDSIPSSPVQGGNTLEVEYNERSRRSWSGTSGLPHI